MKFRLVHVILSSRIRKYIASVIFVTQPLTLYDLATPKISTIFFIQFFFKKLNHNKNKIGKNTRKKIIFKKQSNTNVIDNLISNIFDSKICL